MKHNKMVLLAFGLNALMLAVTTKKLIDMKRGYSVIKETMARLIHYQKAKNELLDIEIENIKDEISSVYLHIEYLSEEGEAM